MTDLATAREQTARIARLNDLARRAMGVACTAVATVGFRPLLRRAAHQRKSDNGLLEILADGSAVGQDDPALGILHRGCATRVI